MQACIRRGAFHDYMRAVFAERSVRARLLRENRAGWLHRLSLKAPDQVPATGKVFLHPG